jgi:hypothetical protein
MFLGSTSNYVLHKSKKPVMIVKWDYKIRHIQKGYSLKLLRVTESILWCQQIQEQQY